MSLLQTQSAAGAQAFANVSAASIDRALIAQIVVAWAGEAGDEDERRLGWWRSSLIAEFGGKDLFQRLLPSTWEWAVLQAAREAARKKDSARRAEHHDPDQIVSLYNFGFDINERIEERLQDLKRSEQKPVEALPDLEIVFRKWNTDRFLDWITGHGDASPTTTPIGRELKPKKNDAGSIDFASSVSQLVAALAPLADSYPVPHMRRAE